MEKGELTDIISLLNNLCPEVQQDFRGKSITVSFHHTDGKIIIPLSEKKLKEGITGLMRLILDLVPAGNSLFVNAEVACNETGKYCSVKLRNTGINLKIVAGVFKKSLFPAAIYSAGEKETVFELNLPLASNGADATPNGTRPVDDSPFNYLSVLKGIRTYFSKIKSSAELLAESNPKEGKFLQSVHTVILTKISDEQFDANALSDTLCMSRAQLLRRLKKLTGLSPGQYIKSIRLQKAKEMLEADATVSEAAFENGFGTLSNFTKVFREKYGITPSQWRQTRPVQQMNKK